MKKLFLVLLLVVMASAMVVAQTQGAHPTTSGSAGSVAPTVDVLGAHQNYGRGCAGCHAPHSGAWGEGGNAKSGTAPTNTPASMPCLGKTWDHSGARRLTSATLPTQEAATNIDS